MCADDVLFVHRPALKRSSQATLRALQKLDSLADGLPGLFDDWVDTDPEIRTLDGETLPEQATLPPKDGILGSVGGSDGSGR